MLLSKPLNPFLFFHRAPLKASEPISSSSLISQAHQALSSLKLIKLQSSSSAYHLSSSSHIHSTPKPKPSPLPSPTPAPGVAVASPSRRRPTPSTLTSLPHRCRPTHVLNQLRRSKPLTHLPTLQSQTHVTAAPPPCSPRLSPHPSPSPAHFRSVLSLHF